MSIGKVLFIIEILLVAFLKKVAYNVAISAERKISGEKVRPIAFATSALINTLLR